MTPQQGPGSPAPRPGPAPPADARPDRRWDDVVADLPWSTPPTTTWQPDTGWLPGGHMNVSIAALDQHLADRGDRVALRWEGEPGEQRTLTYRRIHADVVAVAAGLRGLGLGVGDRVAIAMGLVPEAVILILACARIGAVHAVVPAVLPAEALADRLEDLRPRVVATQDGAWRHGVMLPLKATTDEAVGAVGTIEHTVVVRRTGIDVPWYEGDRWYHDLLDHADPSDGAPVALSADHAYLITHLANRRGRPAGLVHTTGGMATYAAGLHRALCPDDDDVLWAPSELGWMATQANGLLGPLVEGSTAVAYEGMLDVPTPDRIWDVVARHAVTTLLATPSVLRAVRRWVHDAPDPDRVRSLRRVVTAGEPVTDDIEEWLHDTIGHGGLEISNAWGQTELGGLVAVTSPTPLADRLPSAGLAVVDGEGRNCRDGTLGSLVRRLPWPAVAHAQSPDTVAGVADDLPVHTGDRARVDDGQFAVVGRSDRVFSVSGQLVSATEIAAVLVEHPWVRDAEVVDRPDHRRGRAVTAYVTVTDDAPDDQMAVAREVVDQVRTTLGGLATPQALAIVDAFPTQRDDDLLVALESLATTIDGVARMTRDQLTAAVVATRTG